MLRRLRSMLAVAGVLLGCAIGQAPAQAWAAGGATLPGPGDVSGAPSASATRVIGARLGLHPDMTRFVLELAASVTYRASVLSAPNRVVVDLPDLVWPGAEAPKAGTGIIRSYHLERLPTGGARLVIETAGPARIRGAMVMTPSEGHQTRFVLDLAASAGAPVDTSRPEPVTSPVRTPAPPPSPPPPAQSTQPTAPPSAPAPDRTVLPPVLRLGSAATAPPIPLLLPGPGTIHADRPPVQSEPPRVADQPPRVADQPARAPAPAPAPPRTQVAAMAPPPLPSSPAATPSAPAKPRRTGPTDKPVIALDPGHGGVDPGAIGYNGVHEKDITLATAREVRRQLEASGRFRVFMTRDEDEFVPLRERVARARQANAELFISLHADSIASDQIRGLSIYTLSDKASDHEAETLAAKENRSDAIGGVDLSHENDQVATILIDLAQRDTRNHSRRFATMVLREVGRHLRLLPKPDRSAGFAVLTAPDTPSVLIEMGYLSNPDDVALLTQAEHRQHLAASLVHAIEGYFARAPRRS